MRPGVVRSPKFVPMLLVAALLAASTIIFPGIGFAQSGKRVALVVGNNAYTRLPPDKQLNNAINDARAVREAVRGLGFEVIYAENADRSTFIEKLSDLAALCVPKT